MRSSLYACRAVSAVLRRLSGSLPRDDVEQDRHAGRLLGFPEDGDHFFALRQRVFAFCTAPALSRGRRAGRGARRTRSSRRRAWRSLRSNSVGNPAMERPLKASSKPLSRIRPCFFSGARRNSSMQVVQVFLRAGQRETPHQPWQDGFLRRACASTASESRNISRTPSRSCHTSPRWPTRRAAAHGCRPRPRRGSSKLADDGQVLPRRGSRAGRRKLAADRDYPSRCWARFGQLLAPARGRRRFSSPSSRTVQERTARLGM